MNNTIFHNVIKHISTTNFDNILKTATKRISQLSESRQKELKDDLKNGLGKLTNSDQLIMYLAAYGDIHRKKLLMAFKKLPIKIWSEEKISIVDYGSGQCIAEMVLADYLKKHFIDIDFISDITLIEPNRFSLMQGLKYIKGFYLCSEIKPIIASVDRLTSECIRSQKRTVLHIFSNVLDMPNFNYEHISDIINQDKTHNHIILCVSPYYPKNSRGLLMDKFGQMLNCFRCEYKFEKHTDEWDETFSCQIRIFVSGYY